jgi:signal transduction histidine kinase
VDLKAMIKQVVEGLQSQLQQKEQSFKFSVGDSLPPVAGSPTQLSQMITNLIGNAIKYTPVGGEIRVVLRREQNQLILHVVDTGPGIPLDEQSKVFEKFYRASNTQSLAPGTGLGLAIVKSIVENHRGRIWVDSKVGEGSVFTVVLPVAAGSA